MNRIVLILILIISPISLIANGGSVYSRYGIGELNKYFSARQLSLGCNGISFISKNHININNPATWSGLNLELLIRQFQSLIVLRPHQLQKHPNT